jgi:hypothetical protein
MTREYNNQRRDDSRPSFRDRSSNNNGDERAPRPARPRLNREIVDRAWESGAQHSHADYRPRSNNGQPPRKNWRNQSPSETSSSHNGGNRPYNSSNRQEQYRDNPRRFERTSNDNYGPRPRPFDSDNAGRHTSSESQRFGERRGYGERSNGARPTYRDNRDNSQPRSRGGQSGQFQGRDQDRDYRRRDSGRDERGGRNFEHPRRPFDGRGPQEQQPGPDAQNPRWQSRSWVQRDGQTDERQEGPNRPGRSERFEGDYEHFDRRDEAPNRRNNDPRPGPDRPGNRAFRGRHDNQEQEQTEERHVTRLPDGRVLKGPRPVQRKEAQFWTDIAEDTEGLVSQVHIPEAPSPNAEQTIEESEGAEEVVSAGEKPAQPRKPRTRSASSTTRAKKADTAKEGTKGPRPSQRGFKWPKP